MKLPLTTTVAFLASCLATDGKEDVSSPTKPKIQGLRRNRKIRHDLEELQTRLRRDLHESEGGGVRVDRKSAGRTKALKAKNGDQQQVLYVDVGLSDSVTESKTTVKDTLFNHNHGNNVKNNYQTRIVGGQEADPQEYPYYVDMLGCGGSLIAPRVVLSAAHCGDYRGDAIIVGGYEKSTIASEHSVRATVEDQRSHPSYSSSTDENDFTLLLLAADANVPYTSNVILSLDENGMVDGLSSGSPMTVIGLGRQTEGGNTAETLREVVVPYVDDSTCYNTYGADFESSNMHCAGTMGKDSCQGDSGGPIVVIQGNNHIQTGVVSWGSGCGSAGYPGVYAKVSSAESWIKGVVCDEWQIAASFCPGGQAPPPVTPPPPPPVASPTPPPGVKPSPQCFRLDFDWHTDDWPEENYFFLMDDWGNYLFKKEGSFESNKLYRYTAECLDPNSCYALGFYDIWQDGLEGTGFISVSVDYAETHRMSWDIGRGVLFYLGNGCEQ